MKTSSDLNALLEEMNMAKMVMGSPMNEDDQSEMTVANNRLSPVSQKNKMEK